MSKGLFSKFPLLAPEEHPSTDDILAQQGPDFTLAGKTILVTGGSSGIGVETARALASKGAKVFVAVRDIEKTKAALAGVAGLEIIKMELDSFASVNAAADEFLRRSSQLNILINNAGVSNTPHWHTKDGHEYQFGVNHLGHFLLFKRLLPLLLTSSTPAFQSRVVILGSGAHKMSNIDLSDLDWSTRGYVDWKAYGQSKTANALMAVELERRYGDKGVHAWVVHPGGIATELSRHTSGLFSKEGELLAKDVRIKSVSQGAATTLWAAVGKDLEGKGGKYLEDVKIGEVASEAAPHIGYMPYIYDADVAKKLWEYSEKAVQA